MSDVPTELLLALADDDFMLGYRDAEWTGIAPMLEEDIAMSSISQDEIGHARVLYELVASGSADGEPRDDEAVGRRVDGLAYGRALGEYRSCWLVERHRGDWAFTVARRYLYETADEVRTESLASSSHRPLAEVMQKVRREERYHQLHLVAWVERLASSDLARPRFLAALDDVWPDALGCFEPVQGERDLLARGVMPESSAELRERWLGRVSPVLSELRVDLPDASVQPRTGGRQGVRSPEFEAFWLEMTEVYRLDPQAAW